MDFLTTARMLMDIQSKSPDMRYEFAHMHDEVIIRIPIEADVRKLFKDMAEMMKPA